jgi:acetyltransferase-like isoleucine patch superfamily enzyme
MFTEECDLASGKVYIHKNANQRKKPSMTRSIKKALFRILLCFDECFQISQLGSLYQTAKLRRVLKRSYPGLNIQHPVVIKHPENVEIGGGGTIAAFLHIWGGGGVKIGDRVMIGSHVAIASETHDPEAHPMNETFVRAPIRIEDDVWIGTHSVILPGVVIGNGAVIGAGAIVTRDVPPLTVVAGVPAKILRKRQVQGLV